MDKKSIILVYFILVLIPIFLGGCDDSGVIPPPSGTTQVTFNHVFKTLDVSRDGSYELWLHIDTGFVTYGKFNIDASGNPTELDGTPKQLLFPEKYRSKVSTITKAWLTIEPPGDNDSFPSASILVAGGFADYYDSISAELSFHNQDAFGDAGLAYRGGVKSGYICYNKTMPDSGSCSKGLWFCDSVGTPTLDSRIALTSNNGWTYEGWVINKITGSIYSTGRFSDPTIADNDNAGLCAGSSPGFNAPGQEWQIVGCSDITNLQNSEYRIIITIEPKFEYPGSPGFDKPFFLFTLFENPIQALNCGREAPLYNFYNFPGLGFPKIFIRISKG